MKLYTINATPVRAELSNEINDERLLNYRGEVSSIMARSGFDGFTMYPVTGFWEGVQEDSFKIEIAVDNNPERVYTVASELKDRYDQDSVMLTYPDNTVEFI